MTPRFLNIQQNPRKPAQRGNVVRPDQATERQAGERERNSSDACSQPIFSPMKGKPVHTEACKEKMEQTEPSKRPWHRQQQINERARIKHHGVPLGEKWNSTIVQRIPKRNFAAPKGFTMIMRQRVTKQGVVAKEESLRAKDHLRKSSSNQHKQQ